MKQGVSMIQLYRSKKDIQADQLEKKFKELVISYEVKSLPENESQGFIIDGDNKITEPEAITRWLEKLESELKWQRSLSGDGCYIDPETGETC